MSELINNREKRAKVLKELITELHNGKTVDEVRQKFADEFAGVAASEIAAAEQALIAGGLPVAEIQRLCDVHASVFKGSIEEIHRPQDPSEQPGHPAHTIKRENRALERLIASEIEPNLTGFAAGNQLARKTIGEALAKLAEVDKHYSRKENLLFPFLEKNGITAPPKVMWGVDDEIRQLIKDARAQIITGTDFAEIKAKVVEMVEKLTEMIFKEENILLPMALEALKPDEWASIAHESGDLGYCLIDTVPVWVASSSELTNNVAPVQQIANLEGSLIMPTGVLKLQEMIHLLDMLPFDITFVDKDDTVKYFSQGNDRIFARTKAIIGRKVANCHPPASVHIVEKIISDFREGRKDHEDFWIKMGPRYVYIRYFAVRGEAGEFLGTLEVTQDIAPIMAITGEKRLAD